MIILTGGKTGGHITPLIAISKKIDDILYVGNKNSLEEKLCKKNQIPFLGLDTKNNILSIIKNTCKLKLNNVKYIISTGGFVSLPVLIYGILNKIPIFLIEGNIDFGVTNKFFSFFCKKVFLAYEKQNMKKKYVVTGLPTLINNNESTHYNFDILIIGGSLGSKPLCDLVYSLNEKYKIILIAGRFYKEYENIKNVRVFEYKENLNELMKEAKVIISRAGAMTSYEIFLLNKPSIIIPSKRTKNNHQVNNAKFFKKKNLAIYVDEDECNEIANIVTNLLNSNYTLMNIKESQKKYIIKDSIDIILGEIENEFC